jgi:hypothetical protein
MAHWTSNGSSNPIALWAKLAGVSLVIAALLVAAVSIFNVLEPETENVAPVAAPPDLRVVAKQPPVAKETVTREAPAIPSDPRLVTKDARGVSGDQQARLSEEASVRGMRIAIMKYADKEAADYANQLIQAFRKSGAEVQTLLVGMTDEPASGIVLDRNGGDTDPIAAFLAKAGISFQIGQVVSVPPSARVAFRGLPIVVVGLKP